MIFLSLRKPPFKHFLLLGNVLRRLAVNGLEIKLSNLNIYTDLLKYIYTELLHGGPKNVFR